MEPDLYDAIPKVELHCHVEGTVRPATVVDFARQFGRRLPTDDPTELYHYDSLDSFLDIFWLVQELISDRDAWARVAYESILDAAPHGLRYRETFFTPARHLAAGQRLTDIVAGLSEGLELAERETGIGSRLICDIDRAYGSAAALDLVQELVDQRRRGYAERVIGIGMDSTERGVDLRSFGPAYDLARRSGLRLTGHAGEDAAVGAENIAIAVDVLGVDRVDHGVAVVGDADLTQRLAETRIPLTVCPSSNVVVAHRFASLAEHPFSRMRQAGLLVTLNTDDPAMIDMDLGREYRAVAAAQELSPGDVADVALDGIEASWMDDGEKRDMRAWFERDLADLLQRP